MPSAYAIDLITLPALVTVDLHGEIDGEAMPQLREVLATVRRLASPALTLDLTAASYVSLSAMGALLVARSGALEAQSVVLMPGVSTQFRRLITRLDRAGGHETIGPKTVEYRSVR